VPTESKLDDDGVVLLEERGELIIRGRRHVAIDADSFVSLLNDLCGAQVSEVILSNIEYQIGKQDCQRIRVAKPQASVIAVIDDLIKSEAASGVGLMRLKLPQSNDQPMFMELSNPCIKTDIGAGNAFSFSYWAGALAFLIGKDLTVKDVIYDPQSDVKKCRLVPRRTN